jgi:cytochrome c biogenesis protein
MKPILDFFSSVKLTLALLLGLSAVAVFGTIWPVEQGTILRFELYFQSLWFRLLLGLLALNLSACTWKTFARVSGEKKRLLDQLRNADPAMQKTGHDLVCQDIDELSSRLQEQGYRVTLTGDRLLARRGVIGRWALPVLHLSILVIMVGALAAQLGFVGTMNLYVTHQSDEYFDWDSETDVPLGFTFRLDHFEPQYYPIDLRFATYDKETRKQLQEFTTREGERVDISPGLSVSLSGERTYPNSVDLGVEIKLTAFRDPLLKQLHCEVSILENDEVVRQGIIEVNTPLVHRGVAIYQTAYSRDESGFWTCGFQLSKDPGEPLVWLGCVVLTLAILLVFFVRFCAVGVVPNGNAFCLRPLAGFRGEAGQEKLRGLAAGIGRKAPND